MARNERGASLQWAATSKRRRQTPFCLAPHGGWRSFLALADVTRSVVITRISTLRSRLGQRQKEQQRDPLHYFNSLLGTGLAKARLDSVC